MVNQIIRQLEAYGWERSKSDSTTYQKTWRRRGLKIVRHVDRRDIVFIGVNSGTLEIIEQDVERRFAKMLAK